MASSPPVRRPWAVQAIRCLLVLGVFAPVVANAIQKCSVNGVEVNPNNGNATRGLSGLLRCVDADSGDAQREQELREGKHVGIERYFTKGKLVKEFSVNDRGNKQGQSREFAPSGQLLLDQQMENGRLVGLSRRYDADGHLRRVVFYSPPDQELASADYTVNGQLSALRCADSARLGPDVDDAKLCGFKGPSQVEFFDDKRVLHSRLTLNAGKKQRQEYLFAGCAIEHVTQFDSDKRTEQSFSAQGVKVKEERFTLSGTRNVKEFEQHFSEFGKLTEEKHWLDGKPVSESSYYLNGQMQQQSTYSVKEQNTIRHETRYHDNGKLAFEGNSVETSRYRSRSMGVHKYFDEQGRLSAETHYDDKGRVQRQREWGPAGQLTRDDEVFEDGSRKAFVK